MTTADRAEEYDRGHVAGRIEERLTRTETHLAQINGSMADVAEQLGKLNLGVQGLRDEQAASNKAAIAAAAALERTVATTAHALRQADQDRREDAADRWSPWAKVIAVLGGLAALVAVVIALTSGGSG
jgi:sugar phosphate isomerase/epimerase